MCYRIVGCIYTVRNLYGAGQKELVYQNALAEALQQAAIPFHYRIDFVADEKVIIEVKAVTFTPAKMEQQLYGYLRSTPYEVGYLVNLASSKLYLKRVILTNDRKHPSGVTQSI